MPPSITEACKKRKRRAKVYNFHGFVDSSGTINPSGSFRDNIRTFLQECAEPEDYSVAGMPVWSTLLLIQTNNLVLPFYTIEENVHFSPNPFCDHCRCTGWGDNFVCKRKYHVIIPVDGDWNRRLEDGVLDLHTHLLHGLIHCNGFGHLLCINGIEGGSKILCGRELVDLWDRFCSFLGARKISVEDVSKKRSMDLRLLYGVAYGHPWFGRWGYKFCRGSFGVAEYNYSGAIEILSSLELDQIIHDLKNKEMHQIINYYRNLSETQLITLRDLLRFMLTVKSCPCAQKKHILPAKANDSYPASKSSARLADMQNKVVVKQKSVRFRKFSSLVSTLDSRWPIRRLQYAAEVIVNQLKEKKADKLSHGGMTRQEVRDAARMFIGDTGLLDYVLKSMNNVIVGRHVVRRAVNPTTKILEYSIDEHGTGDRVSGMKALEIAENIPAPPMVPGADMYSDLGHLYMKVLLNYPESEVVELATQTILDTKHFVKEWPFRDQDDQILRFVCQVMPSVIEYEGRMDKELPVGEIVMLPLHATVGELKAAAEDAMRDSYCVVEKFVVRDIDGMEDLDDSELLFGIIESGSELVMRGSGMDLNGQLRYERGPDNWKVRCECGAKDDDGERMVACDMCEVWQHTRCNGIEDSGAVPPLFVCVGCCDSLIQSRPEAVVENEENCDDLLMVPASEYVAEFLF
ncbi:PHD finger protein MALE MEIOCYTE DEATH 1 [Euphorbia lathyris]|uniref:PHD finger protein MALE MEIOCYTE DEATH 1 n=1 Tax=Euphorbia lathyris TaxID=212925 RepID=UPI0033143275